MGEERNDKQAELDAEHDSVAVARRLAVDPRPSYRGDAVLGAIESAWRGERCSGGEQFGRDSKRC